MVARVLLAALWLLPTASGALDVERYAALLESHTVAVADIASTRVDYAGLRDSTDWRYLVDDLAKDDLTTLDRAGRLAYWINVYNILTIDMVVREAPEESIRDIGWALSPVWKKPAGRVAGREVTLDEIEHEILRPMGEPRIHAAIVCASLSCPPLRREPYRADALEAQLDDNARAWLADPRKGVRVDRVAGVVRVSAIFDWFEEDFVAVGGVRAFLGRYAPEADRAWLAARGADLELRTLDYDWSLNRVEGR